MASQTTSLDDLPVSPQTEGNIKLETNDKNIKINSVVNNLVQEREQDFKAVTNTGSGVQSGSNSGQDMNNFVTGVQEAVAAGALGLQSRDIPQSQTHLTQDSQMQPNFVPTSQEVDYIGSTQNNENVISEHMKKKQRDNKIDMIYNDIQTPLLLAVIYFIFQLPIVKQTTLRLLPYLFKKDGNPNLTGYVVNSISFATIFYLLSLTLEYFSI